VIIIEWGEKYEHSEYNQDQASAHPSGRDAA
jgi:hypothetical protein